MKDEWENGAGGTTLVEPKRLVHFNPSNLKVAIDDQNNRYVSKF